MPDPKKLPYLLKLLEDDSEWVQEEIARELLAFGEDLDRELERFPEGAAPENRKKVHHFLEEYLRNVLRKQWPAWFDEADDYVRLERALAMLADFQNGPASRDKPGLLLDELAREYRASGDPDDPFSLALFLFRDKKFSGARMDYYNPANSNLTHVIRRRQGIPISLACVYMLTARRLGLTVQGCNFPQHFLARFVWEGNLTLVDCFNGGKFFNEETLSELSPQLSPDLLKVIRKPASVDMIILRVLKNLVRAYQNDENIANGRLMSDLIGLMKEYKEGGDPGDAT